MADVEPVVTFFTLDLKDEDVAYSTSYPEAPDIFFERLTVIFLPDTFFRLLIVGFPGLASRTVILQLALTPVPSLAVAVITAVPAPTAVTLPVVDTVATFTLELDHTTPLTVGLEGE